LATKKFKILTKKYFKIGFINKFGKDVRKAKFKQCRQVCKKSTTCKMFSSYKKNCDVFESVPEKIGKVLVAKPSKKFKVGFVKL